MNQNRRRTDGDETWYRLLEWTKGQKAAERLASHIMYSEGYNSVDPSHPLGGRDGGKDIICSKDGAVWIGAVYFPRGQKDFKTIRKKFLFDLDGVAKNDVDGIAFITNQELTVTERNKLMSANKSSKIEVFHLERLVHILNKPTNYGIRLEYLDIGITTEEQLAYFAVRDKVIVQFSEKIDKITHHLTHSALLPRSEEEIKINEEFKDDKSTDKNRTEEEIVDDYKKKIISEIFMIENYYGKTELFKTPFEIEYLDLSITRVYTNELLVDFYDINNSLSKIGITNLNGFELSSNEKEAPTKLV
ncbi:hypothetical protein P4V64_20140, partial [Bacillus thuringiensis]|nr:hypothetical protein [Bacillus thuringiensis]